MNSIALNQTIFKKIGIIGQGFKGGDRNHASKTPRNYFVWINGVHSLPDISEITEYHELGSIDYPDLMFGMGDGSGEIKYWLGITESEYVLLVGVLLNNSIDDTGEYAVDVASFVFKDRVPIEQSQHHENLPEIAGELLIAHYTHFLGADGAQSFKNSITSDLNKFLSSVIDYYIQNADAEVGIMLGVNISDEEQNIINKMVDIMKKDD